MRLPTLPTPILPALSPVTHWLRGFGLLLLVAALGQLLSQQLHLPMPGSVTGMLLLWLALQARLVQVQWLEPAADHLLSVLGLLFVPATMGIINYFSAGAAWLLWLLVMVGGLLLGSAAAGLAAQKLLRPEKMDKL